MTPAHPFTHSGHPCNLQQVPTPHLTDLKPDKVSLQGHSPPGLLVQERADAHRLGPSCVEMSDYLCQGQASVHDVLNLHVR